MDEELKYIIDSEIQDRLTRIGFNENEVAMFSSLIYELAEDYSYAVPKLQAIDSALNSIESTMIEHRILN